MIALLLALSVTRGEPREAANAGLKALGPGVAPFLKASLQTADAEAKARINGLLEDWAPRRLRVSVALPAVYQPAPLVSVRIRRMYMSHVM